MSFGPPLEAREASNRGPSGALSLLATSSPIFDCVASLLAAVPLEVPFGKLCDPPSTGLKPPPMRLTREDGKALACALP